MIALAAVLTPAVAAAPPGSPNSPTPTSAELWAQVLTLAATPEEGGILSREEQNLLADVVGPTAINAQTRAALEKAAPILELARQAAHARQTALPLDRSRGFAMMLPHLASMRQVSRLLEADLSRAIADGDRAAVLANIDAATRISLQPAQDDVAISSLVAVAMFAKGDRMVDQALEHGVIDAEGAAALAKSFASIEGQDPFGFANAVEGEAEMMRISVMEALDGEGLEQLLSWAGSDDAGAELGALDRDEVIRQLDETEALVQRCSDAFREEDPDVARAILAEVSDAMQSEDAPLLARMLMPAYGKMYENKLRADTMLEERLQQLRAIASGASTTMFTNAAGLYLRAAQEAARTRPSDQRVLEAYRLTDGALDAEQVEQVAALLRHVEEGVLVPMRTAGGLKNCEFSVSVARTWRPTALPWYLSGVRAASRLVASDALHTAATLRDAPPESTVARQGLQDRLTTDLVTLINVARHLAGDPTTAHAVLAEEILRETAPTLETILHWSVLDEAHRDRVQLAVEAIDRADPLGFKGGLDADRVAIIDGREAWLGHLSVPRSSIDDRMRRIRALDGDRFASLLVLFGNGEGTLPCEDVPDAPLMNASDLRDAAACAELEERRTARIAARTEAFSQGRLPEAGPPMAGLTLPPVMRVNERAARAGESIGRLDALFRPDSSSHE